MDLLRQHERVGVHSSFVTCIRMQCVDETFSTQRRAARFVRHANAGQPKYCSCASGIPAIHGGQKKRGACAPRSL